ncbi:MAG: WYL domain-containing protein [Bacteroidales bacterium]|nr:WYL domain-containing protein [Candidatus Cacconaster merdequi]
MNFLSNKERWEILDSLLSSGEAVSRNDVTAAFCSADLSCGQVTQKVDYFDLYRKDIKMFRDTLKKSNLPDLVETSDGLDKRCKLFRYADPGFSILPYLHNFHSKADFRHLNDWLNKLSHDIPSDLINDIKFAVSSRLEDSCKIDKFIEYSDTNKIKGQHFKPVLYDAIQRTATLLIKYKPFGQDESSFVFVPFLLKQYNDRWFVFGYKPENKDMYCNLALDRIVCISESETQLNIKRPENYSLYWANVIGVTTLKDRNTGLPYEPVDILIGVHTIKDWGYIITKPLHSSQTISIPFNGEKNYGQIKITVRVNRELNFKILSLGPGYVVESPYFVRNKMKGMISTLSDLYNTEPEEM